PRMLDEVLAGAALLAAVGGRGEHECAGEQIAVDVGVVLRDLRDQLVDQLLVSFARFEDRHMKIVLLASGTKTEVSIGRYEGTSVVEPNGVHSCIAQDAGKPTVKPRSSRACSCSSTRSPSRRDRGVRAACAARRSAPAGSKRRAPALPPRATLGSSPTRAGGASAHPRRGRARRRSVSPADRARPPAAATGL